MATALYIACAAGLCRRKASQTDKARVLGLRMRQCDDALVRHLASGSTEHDMELEGFDIDWDMDRRIQANSWPRQQKP